MAYVNDNSLSEALLASHSVGYVTEECYKMFEDIAKQRLKRLLKYNTEYYDEILANCVDKCCKIWHSYSFKRDKPFAYFVTVIDNTIKLFFMVHTDVHFVSIDEQEERYAESD